MMGMEKNIAAQETVDQIRERLAAATPGPWKLAGGGEYIAPVGILVAPDDGGVSRKDAVFIANAPADIAWLIARVEALTPATVASAAELDALPVGSVVLDKQGGAWTKAGDGSVTWWFTGDGIDFESKSSLGVASLFGPVTVLHRGGMGSGTTA